MPSSITAGAASAKISELKSKVAVYAALSDVIRANYLPADGAAAELTLYRDDKTSVAPDHIELVIQDLDNLTREALEELKEWEGLTFEPKRAEGADVRHIQAPEPKHAPSPAPEKKHGRRSFGAAGAGKSG